MNRIIELPSHLADMIAAGEVVERPSSVVKELFENAVDAGADTVSVEITGGGLTYIRVTDNGSGISRGDIERAFLRHATSKISSETDLEAINTLGFRGEALAAISSVSRVEMITRTEDEQEGTRAALDGGDVVSIDVSARPRGTTVTVRDLFFNTPARQKFMKTDRAEAANVTAAVTRLALSRPDVSVRYTRDGAEEMHTPGDARADSCVYAALGREFAGGMLAFDYDGDGARAHGFVSKVSALRGNRNYQFFFVNGRSVRSRTLQAALEQAYRNRMFTGRFPSCVVYIETGAGRLDVNVHPSKTEIKFLFEKQIFDAVYYGALSALEDDGAPQDIAETRPVFEPLPPPVQTPRAPAQVAREPQYPRRDAQNPAELPIRAPAPREYAVTPQPPEPEPQTELAEIARTPDYRVVGEALGTYIVVESGGSLWLVDKHAAHERVHFDRLRGENPNPMPQALLEPVIVTPDGDGAELLLQNAEMLSELGFSVEDFGGGKLAVRQIPSD
ncbi:MAG: DNA mismatch repair endonuclease MutL, partial [Oscillospiraceae bacterium]|nr:DNA mismatch repair endonuclease MutL [Oscillospiraceae bacterium]